MDIAELDRVRFAFLKRLYDLSEGNRRRSFQMLPIGRELSLDKRMTDQIFDYLKEEGLAELHAAGPMVGITHEGIRVIEDSLAEPEAALGYFPEINIAVIGQMIHSQLQQGYARLDADGSAYGRRKQDEYEKHDRSDPRAKRAAPGVPPPRVREGRRRRRPPHLL